MKKHVSSKHVVLALLVALSLGAVWRWTRDPERARVPVAPSPYSSFHWPAGNLYRYALEWEGSQSSQLLGGAEGLSGGGRVQLKAELVLRSYGEREGATLLGASLERLESHSFHALGEELFPSREVAVQSLTGHEGFVELTPDGRIRALYFDKPQPDAFKDLLGRVLAMGQVTLAAENTWEAEERGDFGEGPFRYARPDVAARPALVERTRLGYSTVTAVPGDDDLSGLEYEGGARIELHPEGHLLSLDSEERVQWLEPGTGEERLKGQSRFRLALVALERTERSAPRAQVVSGLERREPGEVVISEAVRQRMLEQRADGMTAESLMDDLRMYAASGHMPDHNAWFWRASAVLELHPELCAELAFEFEQPQVTSRARGLILDLLVATGSAEAQEALRTALSSATAKQDWAQGLMVQRLGLVSEPTPETLAFLADRYEQTTRAHDSDLRYASAYALGASVSNAAASGQEALAAEYNRLLVADLPLAQSPEEKSALLTALGNAGLEENVPALLGQLEGGNPDVREAVANALRKTVTPEATSALLGLLADEELAVQAMALESLHSHGLGAAHLSQIEALLESGKLPNDHDARLLPLLTRNLKEDGARVRGMLERMLERSAHNPGLAEQLRQTLELIRG